jgi:hypothetical protein
MIESDHEFGCPYCGAPNSLRVDASGGRRQDFVTDCEVCCRPIEIEVDRDPSDGTVFLTAKREGEG